MSSASCRECPPSPLVVRDVAPAKLMLCLTFELPPQVAWADDTDTQTGDASALSVAAGVEHPKRQKLDGLIES